MRFDKQRQICIIDKKTLEHYGISAFLLNVPVSLVTGNTEFDVYNFIEGSSPFVGNIRVLGFTNDVCRAVGATSITPTNRGTATSSQTTGLTTLSVFPDSASCSSCSTSFGNVVLTDVTPCGKRIVLVYGRPVTVNTLTTQGACTFNSSATRISNVNDGGFLGAGPFTSTPTFPAPITFEVPICTCSATPGCSLTCQEERALFASLQSSIDGVGGAVNAVGSSVNNVGVAVGGVASAVGGVGGSVGSVGTSVRGDIAVLSNRLFNSTLSSTTVLGVRNNVLQLLKDVKKVRDACNDAEDEAKDAKDEAEDNGNQLDDIEEELQKVHNKVKDIRDEVVPQN